MNLQQIKQIEDLLTGLGYTFDKYDLLDQTYLKKADLYELIEGVWNIAIETAADNAEADVNWLDEHLQNLTCGEDYEVYVLKNSILKLKV